MVAMEKCGSDHVEGADGEHNLPRYHNAETARVLRRIDWRLLPVLTLLYLLSFLDRGNIGNAKVAGMNKDLHLTSSQYNITLTVSGLIHKESGYFSILTCLALLRTIRPI